jgi:hypothetical protein
VVIDERTKITLGLAVTLICGVTWLSTIYATELQHGKKIDKLETIVENRTESDNEFKREVIDRLSRIEGRLQEKNP